MTEGRGVKVGAAVWKKREGGGGGGMEGGEQRRVL